MATIVIRVISPAGRSRVEMPPSDTIGNLRAEIAKRLGVDAKALKLFKDPA
jgi:hypothetical protein|tara:strand:+ start:84 stop:236 length:153 start_codon:yes stop_codon:yes gene_type:complete